MSETYVTVAGNVATVPDLKVTQSGASFVKFRLATTPRRHDRSTGRWNDGPTSFYTVTCWRGLADNVASSLGKGDPVVVVGRLRVNTWETDRASGTTAEIEGVHVGHDLSKGIALFRKVKLARPGDGERRAQGGGPDLERGHAAEAGHDLADETDPSDERVDDLAAEYDSGPLVPHEPGGVSQHTAA
ncbi:MAG TPA: single-stranded DNA-binding protein [Jiangellales bacterium]|nr:single-stranded DNA-binding protein [Jiangellales bacterium]